MNRKKLAPKDPRKLDILKHEGTEVTQDDRNSQKDTEKVHLCAGDKSSH